MYKYDCRNTGIRSRSKMHLTIHMEETTKKTFRMSFTIGIFAALIVLGIFTGILSGIVGVGGGIILVPALVYFFNTTQLQAQGTSLALLMFPVGILAVMQYYKQGHIDFRLVGIIALGFVLGSFMGSKIALSLPQDLVKKIFAVLLLIISVKMLFFDAPQKTTEESKNKPAAHQ
jgi:uncharacterized membrane protein YfcA